MFAPEGENTNGYLVVGATGCGKSTWLAKRIQNYNGNAIVYKHFTNIDDAAFNFLTTKTIKNIRQGVPPGENVKCKIGGFESSDYIAFLDWVKKNFRNGMLVIDDATIFERDRLSKQMNFLLTMKRHLGIDIFLVYHGLTLLPIEQFLLCKAIVLFNTTDNLSYKAKKTPKYRELENGIILARNNFRSGDKKKKYSPVIIDLR